MTTKAELQALLERVRQATCRHQWRPTRFQALVHGTSYKCTKCGKCQQMEPPDGGGKTG